MSLRGRLRLWRKRLHRYERWSASNYRFWEHFLEVPESDFRFRWAMRAINRYDKLYDRWFLNG